jgi:hypothetical protein
MCRYKMQRATLATKGQSATHRIRVDEHAELHEGRHLVTDGRAALHMQRATYKCNVQQKRNVQHADGRGGDGHNFCVAARSQQ